jgi:membrane protein YqaA with SNARE-associated domain
MTEINEIKKTNKWHIHKRLYDWVLHFAHTKHGEVALFCISFAESSFFPIPPDTLLAPLALGAPKKWLRFASLCSVASVFGGITGYLIGIFLWAAVGNFFHDYIPGFSRDRIVLTSGAEINGMIDRKNLNVKMRIPSPEATITYPFTLVMRDGTKRTLTKEDVNNVTINTFTKVGALYTDYDWELVAMAGFTPFPYKVITITAGVFKINFIVFIIASALSRSARFFMVAGLFGWKGETIRPFIDKYFNWLTLIFTLLLIGGFLAIKLFK